MTVWGDCDGRPVSDASCVVLSLICARREFKSPITLPTCSSEIVICIRIIGSNSKGFAFLVAFSNASTAAASNATSEESVGWYEPLVSVTFTSCIGYPMRGPVPIAPSNAFSIMGMYCRGICISSVLSSNSNPSPRANGSTVSSTSP